MKRVVLINDFNELLTDFIENESLFCPFSYDTFKMI